MDKIFTCRRIKRIHVFTVQLRNAKRKNSVAIKNFIQPINRLTFDVCKLCIAKTNVSGGEFRPLFDDSRVKKEKNTR